MSRDAVKTLFHLFAADMLEMPKSGERVLFLGAEAGTARPAGFDADIVAVQNLRPLYRALQAQSADVTPDIPEGSYDAALILCGKHRGETKGSLHARLAPRIVDFRSQRIEGGGGRLSPPRLLTSGFDGLADSNAPLSRAGIREINPPVCRVNRECRVVN